MGENFLQGPTKQKELDEMLVLGVYGTHWKGHFLDVRVFHAQAPSNKALGSPTNMYNSHERQKKNLYNKRIVEVEHGTFTPIVLSTTGGMGREANMFFKKLADKLSRKSGQRYSIVRQ